MVTAMNCALVSLCEGANDAVWSRPRVRKDIRLEGGCGQVQDRPAGPSSDLPVSAAGHMHIFRLRHRSTLGQASHLLVHPGWISLAKVNVLITLARCKSATRTPPARKVSIDTTPVNDTVAHYGDSAVVEDTSV